jgi:hypothetical protein
MNSAVVIGVKGSVDFHRTIAYDLQAADVNVFFLDSQQHFGKLGRIEAFFLWCSSAPALSEPVGRQGDLLSNALQRIDQKCQHP